MEAEGVSCDGADLPVEPLDAAVVEARLHVGEDPLAVLLDRPRELAALSP